MAQALRPGRRPILMLVTDRFRVPAAGERDEALCAAVARAVDGGVDIIQLREKDLDTRALTALGRRLREAVQDRAALLVNGDIEAAAAIPTDGVHLPASAPPANVARRLLPPGSTITAAVHSLATAQHRAQEGADLLVLGTVFATKSKPGTTTIGIHGVHAVCAAVETPVIVIGGMTAANAGDVIRAGARGVAVIGAILESPDPREAARALRTAIDRAAEIDE